MADWKNQTTYNYNHSYHAYAYGVVYTPEQNSGWSQSAPTDFSYNSGTAQACYTASNAVQTEEGSPGVSSGSYTVNGQRYQGSGLVYVGNPQTGHLLLAARPYRTAALEAWGNQAERARQDSVSDSEAHTSPNYWSSGSSREVGFPQTDPSLWMQRAVAGGSEDVSSSLMDEPQTFSTSENMSTNDPTRLAAPQTDLNCPQSPAANKPTSKVRVAFSGAQMNALSQRFKIQKYLTPKEMKDLAEKINLTYKQVKTWFQNRRMKLRRLQKDNNWQLEFSGQNRDGSVYAPTFSSMPSPYSDEGCPPLRQHCNQHALKAYYLAAGSAGYPPWSVNLPQAAIPHVNRRSGAPASSHLEPNLYAFSSVRNESKDGEPRNRQGPPLLYANQ
ncbi:homeobox protein NANOG [Nothobranchius furzeri]|uniref:Nanog homeobox n=1 Tax=Nothobranchius furzeri TaxID=105023 RepID=A0A8C6KV61_NOTFU|nr:homeobox protein NANOG [Nothobranchius furzeri]